MWRCVDLVWTDVSEECIASIFKVENPVTEVPAWASGYSLKPPAIAIFLTQYQQNNNHIPQCFFLIWIVGGGAQMGLLGTAATNRPLVPTPGDYDDGEIGGMMIGRRNRSTRRKPAPVPLLTKTQKNYPRNRNETRESYVLLCCYWWWRNNTFKYLRYLR
jgi:hypothetical protein